MSGGSLGDGGEDSLQPLLVWSPTSYSASLSSHAHRWELARHLPVRVSGGAGWVVQTRLRLTVAVIITEVGKAPCHIPAGVKSF